MEHPHVSVVSLANTAAQFIRVAIESILTQTFSDFEVNVADSDSKDGRTVTLDRFVLAAPCDSLSWALQCRLDGVPVAFGALLFTGPTIPSPHRRVNIVNPSLEQPCSDPEWRNG
jgi:glycosyltransferase involved in cell wall biosynthesis